MAQKSGRLVAFALILIAFPGSAGPVAAQGANRIETVLQPNVTLPQTAWMRAETHGQTPADSRLRETVDLLLHQRGFRPEKFSPYVVRIEMRLGGGPPLEAAIPQYANRLQRLSLWNDNAPVNSVTISLLLYHQSTGRIYWQAEARCEGLTTDAIPAAMIVPMMNEFGRSSSGELACTRSS